MEVEKFNPYHDRLGRFATSNSHTSFTIRTKDPKKQHWADRAIEREKARAAAAETEREKAREAERAKVTFTPAKSKKAAIAYAQNELGFTKASYGTKLDLETINHINEQITLIQAKFPETKGACQELKTTTSGCYAQICTRYDGSMSFEIGSKLYGAGMDYIKRCYERDTKAGFHPAGTDEKAVVWHEYGHVLACISAKGKFGVSPQGKIAANYTQQSNFITDRRARSTEREWLTTAAKETGKSASKLASDISRYAQKNAAETFAEAFAEVMCSPNPGESSVAIVKASGWYR